MFGVEVVELVKPGELDKVPPGKWAAIKDGKAVAWPNSLEELRRVMERKGYKRGEYYVNQSSESRPAGGLTIS
ncbi:MAG: hypothetical protein DRO12_05745 [Thermoprotei archaeon]|nr:MAG: hypothetical protein DRO12_05745 [Thermoprotei archaeon]